MIELDKPTTSGDNLSFSVLLFFSQVGCIEQRMQITVFQFMRSFTVIKVFPDVSEGKESACNVADIGDKGLISGSGRSPGVGNGNPLQYSCLKTILWTEEPGGLQFKGSRRT